MKKVKMAGTNLLIEEERLSTLLKVFREGEDSYFAQMYIQTGIMGEAVIKGLSSPVMNYRKRKELNDAIYAYLYIIGYKTSTMQRVKLAKDEKTVTTIRKKLKVVGA
jgi:hypothetical protein